MPEVMGSSADDLNIGHILFTRLAEWEEGGLTYSALRSFQFCTLISTSDIG